MEEMGSLWSYQESSDELMFKIHYTALELEAVRAKANEEMNNNSESVKQLLHLLKLVCQERDEARDQIQKLLNKNMHSINKSMIKDCFMKPANANSTSLSDHHAYNHYVPVTSPEFSNINCTLNTSFMNHATLMLENMIKGKTLPQKGNLLKAVVEAGPLLQTLFAANPPRFFGKGGQNHITMVTKQSQQLFENEIMSSGSYYQMTGGGDGSILSFDHMNSSNCHLRMTGSNFGSVEKRQRFH